MAKVIHVKLAYALLFCLQFISFWVRRTGTGGSPEKIAAVGVSGTLSVISPGRNGILGVFSPRTMTELREKEQDFCFFFVPAHATSHGESRVAVEESAFAETSLNWNEHCFCFFPMAHFRGLAASPRERVLCIVHRGSFRVRSPLKLSRGGCSQAECFIAKSTRTVFHIKGSTSADNANSRAMIAHRASNEALEKAALF